MDDGVKVFPIGTAFRALVRAMPLLVGFALTSAIIFILGLLLAFTTGTGAVRTFLFGAVCCYLVLSHAAYLVFASRRITYEISGASALQKLTLGGWLGMTLLSLLVLIAATGISLAIGFLFFGDRWLSGAFAVTLALLAWSPFVTIVAVEGRYAMDAFGAMSGTYGGFFVSAVAISIPLLGPIIFLGYSLLNANGGWGLFEGGMFLFPLFAFVVFCAATSVALVPAVVYAEAKKTMGFAP